MFGVVGMVRAKIFTIFTLIGTGRNTLHRRAGFIMRRVMGAQVFLLLLAQLADVFAGTLTLYVAAAFIVGGVMLTQVFQLLPADGAGEFTGAFPLLVAAFIVVFQVMLTQVLAVLAGMTAGACPLHVAAAFVVDGVVWADRERRIRRLIAYFAGIVALRPFAPFIRVMEAAFVAVVLVVFAQADAVVT